MTTSIHGEQLEYQELGAGPAVVLLQGSLAEQAYWQVHASTLVANGFRVIQISLAQEQQIAPRTLAGFLRYLGIGRAVLVGLTSQGLFLEDLKRQYPERVAATCLISPSAHAQKSLAQIWCTPENAPGLVLIGEHDRLAAQMVGHDTTGHLQRQTLYGKEEPPQVPDAQHAGLACRYLLSFLNHLHAARPKHRRWANVA